MTKTVVLKLGGALLTDKSKPFALREEVLGRVAEEISECIESGLINKLVLIHGVGSFGHPPVLKYKLHKGFQISSQLLDLSITQKLVDKLKLSIIEAFQHVDIPIISMYASSMVVGNEMKITEYMFDALKGYLSLGMVPLVGGDMMYDQKMGFSVCSGDQLAIYISREIQANYLIFATDVAGVYDSDPKKIQNAELIKNIEVDSIPQIIKQIGEANKADASRKMKGKLNSISLIADLIKKDLDVAILSMMGEGTLFKYLCGEEVLATKIYSK